MGLARVQNDCKTKWIPNIWKNEAKGRVTCKALAPADVWVPLCLPQSRGLGPQTCPLGDSCPGVGRKGIGFLKPTPEQSEKLESRPGRPLTSAMLKPLSEIMKKKKIISEQVRYLPVGLSNLLVPSLLLSFNILGPEGRSGQRWSHRGGKELQDEDPTSRGGSLYKQLPKAN